MATNIPPHNLTEVVNAAIELVKNPKAGLAEVLKHVHGPDFPTGAILYGRTGIVDAYRTGRGRFLMRARVAIENVTKELKALVVTEIPYQVNKSTLFKRIAELVENKIISDIDISRTARATRATATACGSSSASSAARSLRSCSTSSTSTPNCRKASP